MNELIKLHLQTMNSNTVDTVSARELHTFLESKQQFATWIKNRISEYDFVENQDFVCVSQKNETQRADGQIGVSVSNEYYITLDMAKELAMVERNIKGKQARKYFIECEKKLKEQATTPTDPLLMIAHMAQQAYETKLLAQQVAQRQDSMEQAIKEVQAKQEALTDSSNFFSVLAFANLHEVGLTNGKLSALSKKAGKLSEKLGMAVGIISDPRWGKVKTYHKDILVELFEHEQLL